MELAAMRQSVQTLKESLSEAERLSGGQRKGLEALEGRLKAVLLNLEESEADLIKSKGSLEALKMQVSGLKKELNELSGSLKQAKRGRLIWQIAAGLSIGVAAGAVIWAALK